MKYIENIVIGTPIVNPKSMFTSLDDDWDTVEKEKTLYRRTFFTTYSCRSGYIPFGK